MNRLASVEGRADARIAGGLAGLAGLATFLVLHHLLIVPIWFIAPIGALFATGGGAVAGTAYAELVPRLPGRPWRTAAVAVIFGLILVPAVVVGEATGPMFVMDADGGTSLLVPEGDAIASLVLGLVGSAVATGLLLGGVIGRTSRAAGWTGLSGLVLALGPGHNVPFLAASPAAAKGVVLLAAVVLVASLVLVAADAALGRRRHATRAGTAVDETDSAPRAAKAG